MRQWAEKLNYKFVLTRDSINQNVLNENNLNEFEMMNYRWNVGTNIILRWNVGTKDLFVSEWYLTFCD
jgi:hypothetical protein